MTQETPENVAKWDPTSWSEAPLLILSLLPSMSFSLTNPFQSPHFSEQRLRLSGTFPFLVFSCNQFLTYITGWLVGRCCKVNGAQQGKRVWDTSGKPLLVKWGQRGFYLPMAEVQRWGTEHKFTDPNNSLPGMEYRATCWSISPCMRMGGG